MARRIWQQLPNDISNKAYEGDGYLKCDLLHCRCGCVGSAAVYNSVVILCSPSETPLRLALTWQIWIWQSSYTIQTNSPS